MARKLLEKDAANPRSERDVAFSLDKVGDVKATLRARLAPSRKASV